MHLGVAYSVWCLNLWNIGPSFNVGILGGLFLQKMDRTFIMEVGHKNSIQTTMTTRRISIQPLETALFPSYSLSMAPSLSSSSSFATFRCPNPRSSNSAWCRDNSTARVTISCESNGSQSSPKLEIGSPIIVIEAPKTIKTAASVPCLRVNSGLVNPGDVGRIVSRKPMDVWAVRLAIGTYLIDRKYFKPLNIAAESSDDTPELNP